MAIFLETLADAAVVAEACEQARMGLSGAYALRRRNAFFATPWHAALGLPRKALRKPRQAPRKAGRRLENEGRLVFAMIGC